MEEDDLTLVKVSGYVRVTDKNKALQLYETIYSNGDKCVDLIVDNNDYYLFDEFNVEGITSTNDDGTTEEINSNKTKVKEFVKSSIDEISLGDIIFLNGTEYLVIADDVDRIRAMGVMNSKELFKSEIIKNCSELLGKLKAQHSDYVIYKKV